MLVLITILLKKEELERKVNRIELLISNFIRVGFINVEKRQEKLVFKGFIENEYDIYFYSLLKFLFAYDEKNRRNGCCDIIGQAKIVVKNEGKIIYDSTLYSFYWKWRTFKHPEILQDSLSDEEYEAYSEYCQQLYEYIETHDIKKELDEYRFKNSDL